MGGAERNARKKRQAQAAGRTGGAKPAAAKPVAAARTSGDRKKVIITVVAVVVLAGAVLGGVIYTNNQKNATEGKDIHGENKAATQPTELDVADLGTYPAVRQDAVVQVGAEDAKTTIDVYEDFLCPSCRAFEARYGKTIDEQLRAGTIKVRYHMLPMLNEQSDPAGYSMDSANAGLCAADGGKFTAYHLSLFRAQPQEGARGWDNAQLTKLGTDLGITDPAFGSCIAQDKYDSLVAASFEQVRNSRHLQQETPDGKNFVTPTIAVDRKVINIDPEANPRWLDKLVDRAK